MVAICIAKRNVFMLFYDNSNAMICKDSLLVDVATICYDSHEDIWDLKEKEYYMDEELQVRYLDSCYEELTTINNRNHVILVKHKETGELRIKKILTRYDINLYKRLIDNPIAGVPQIYEFFQIDKGLIVIEEYVNGKTLDELLNRLRGHFKKGTLGAGAEHFMEPYHSYDGTWKRFLPVGFRTCRIWKMAPAFLGYMFLLYSCVLMEMDGLPENKPCMLTVLRIMCFMMLIFNVFYIGNYLGIRYKLPGTKVNIGIHILLNIIYLILINFFIVKCMSMFVSMFSL